MSKTNKILNFKCNRKNEYSFQVLFVRSSSQNARNNNFCLVGNHKPYFNELNSKHEHDLIFHCKIFLLSKSKRNNAALGIFSIRNAKQFINI